MSRSDTTITPAAPDLNAPLGANAPPGGTARRSSLDLRARFTGLLPTRADITAVRRNPRRDLVAGVTVAVVALPLALAFGVASGLGAQAGLATAVVAGIAVPSSVARTSRSPGRPGR